MAAPRAGGDVANAPAEVEHADAIAAAQVVLGRPRRPPRTARSRLLDRPSTPPLVPRSDSVSSSSSTWVSRSAHVAVTWSSPVRDDTFQLIRRSRSPVRNGRTSAGSEPPPCWLARCSPTWPAGRGTASAASNSAVSGSVETPIIRPSMSLRYAPRRDVHTTRSSPASWRPQRRARTGTAATAPAAAPATATAPETGSIPIHGEAATTTVTMSPVAAGSMRIGRAAGAGAVRLVGGGVHGDARRCPLPLEQGRLGQLDVGRRSARRAIEQPPHRSAERTARRARADRRAGDDRGDRR